MKSFNVNTTLSASFEISIENDSKTVNDLQKMILEKSELSSSTHKIVLMHGGKYLESDQALSEAFQNEHSAILAIIRERQAQTSQNTSRVSKKRKPFCCSSCPCLKRARIMLRRFVKLTSRFDVVCYMNIIIAWMSFFLTNDYFGFPFIHYLIFTTTFYCMLADIYQRSSGSLFGGTR